MENKIQELADKIYREGVEKGNVQAQGLLDEANKKAAEIIAKANKESETIIAKAKAKADELTDNTKSELKLFANQSINALKTEVTDILVNQTVSATVSKATSDQTFLNQFILELAKHWASNEDIVISTKDATALKTYFAANAKELLDKSVTIEEVNGIKTHFAVSPKDGSYKLTFGDDEFINYFKAFLRPQLIEMLFGANK